MPVTLPLTDTTMQGAGDPPSTTLIGDVPVEGVEVLEEFVYLGSTQSSDGYC